MDWVIAKSFEYDQTKAITPETLQSANRGVSFSPTDASQATDAIRAVKSMVARGETSKQGARGETSKSRAKTGRGKQRAREPEPSKDKAETSIPDKVLRVGLCATLSLIWIRAALDPKVTDRRNELRNAMAAPEGGDSELRRLALAYANPKVSKAEHAEKTGVSRTKPIEWPGKTGDVREWFFKTIATDSGFKTGAWNLTRVREDGRHRLGLYSTGNELVVFNPNRGEWRMFREQGKGKAKENAFHELMSNAGLESKRGKVITRLEVWNCTRN